MIKNDKWIRAQAEKGMISPFIPKLIRSVGYSHQSKVLSFGLSSYGYDIRLSPKEFLIFRHIPGQVIDPKNFDPANLEPAPFWQSNTGDYFIMPGHSYGLGVALEKISLPNNVIALCVGKSTPARAGLIANITPVEPGWSGHLTLEFSNSSPADVRIYANEGCVQLVFFEGDPCETSYADRHGKYQNQSEEVTIAKV